MRDGDIVAWASFAVELLGALGGLIGMIAGLAALLMRRTFASREDVDKKFAAHAGEHRALDHRLADGETRFAKLSGAIEMVKAAAEQATGAAHDAREAADSAKDASIDIAELKGSIKSIERLTMTMVEGHMASGMSSRVSNG